MRNKINMDLIVSYDTALCGEGFKVHVFGYEENGEVKYENSCLSLARVLEKCGRKKVRLVGNFGNLDERAIEEMYSQVRSHNFFDSEKRSDFVRDD
jgi:hypothetical protein